MSAAIATIVAFISILLSLYGLYVQRQHNRVSVLPVGVIDIWDYPREIVVRLRNGGIGPLKIKAITVKCANSGLVTTTIHEQVGALGHRYRYSQITGNPSGRVLSPGGKQILLRLTGDPSNTDFADKRDNIRRVLSNLSVKVTYSDAYGRTVGTAERRLHWFGRHFREYDIETDTLGETLEPSIPWPERR